MKPSQIRDLINCDTISCRGGIFTARFGFFYRHNGTSEKCARRIERLVPGAVVLDHSEVWKAFRGGASTRNQSHWWVTFRISETVAALSQVAELHRYY